MPLDLERFSRERELFSRSEGGEESQERDDEREKQSVHYSECEVI